MIEPISINTNLPEVDFNKIQRDSFIDVSKDLEYPPTAISMGEHNVGQ